VSYDALTKLLGLVEPPDRSPIGLTLVVLSLIVMPSLAWAKRRVAAGLGSVALRADAAQTNRCTYLSAVVLLGLAANALAGWWWMDPIAGMGGGRAGRQKRDRGLAQRRALRLLAGG